MTGPGSADVRNHVLSEIGIRYAKGYVACTHVAMAPHCSERQCLLRYRVVEFGIKLSRRRRAKFFAEKGDVCSKVIHITQARDLHIDAVSRRGALYPVSQSPCHSLRLF